LALANEMNDQGVNKRSADALDVDVDVMRQRSALIDLSFEPIFVWDLDGGITDWNAGAEMLYGFTFAEAVGRRSHHLLRSIHTTPFEQYLGRLETDGHWSGEIRQFTKDGREIWIESRQQIIHSAGRRLVIEINRHITTRRAQENRLALLATIGELIRTTADPSALLYEISKQVGEFFDVRRCLFNEIDVEQDREIVHRDHCRGVNSVAGEHKLSVYSPITTADLMAGRTVVNSDSATDPRTSDLYDETYEPTGERAYVAVPLMRDGTWVASLWLSDDKPREWDEADVTMLETVAERAWAAVERLRAEAALRESRERFEKAFNSSPLAVTITSLSTGKLVDVNDTFVTLTGYHRSEAVGHTTVELGLWEHPADREEELARVISEGKISNVEYRFRLRGGCEITGLLSAELIDIGGEQCALTVIQDITQRKRSEGIAQRYRLLSEQSTDIIWFTHPDGSFVDVNLAAILSYGYSRDEFLKMNVKDVRHPSGIPDLQEQLDLANTTGVHFETLHVRKDGSAFPVEVKANAADFAGERLIMAIVRDITERKKADEALRKSEDLFSRFMQHLPGLAWIKDHSGRYLYVNDAAEKAFNRSRQMLYGKTDAEVFPPEIAAQFSQNDERAFTESAGLQTVEELTQSDGTVHHSIVSKFPIPQLNDETRLIGGMAIDITDRMQAEAALRESEERRHLAQEAGNVGVWDWNVQTGKTYWSGSMWSIYGEKPVDINPDETFWSAHIHEADRERAISKIQKVVRSKDDRYRDEFRIIRRDGKTRWIEAIAQVSRDSAGKAVRMFGVNLDITERKAAEERIRQSESQLRLVTNTLPALISYVDRDERLRFVNQKYAEWFQRPVESLIGKKVRGVIGSRAYTAMKPAMEQALSGQESNFEGLLDFRTAGARYVHASYVPDIGVDGSVLGYYGLAHDLTELKRSEDLLRSSEDRIHLMMESLTDYAVFSIDAEGRIDSWNKGAKSIFGYSQDEILGKPYDHIFTPDDVQRGVPAKEMRIARNKGRAFDERWHLKRDGSRFFASGVMMPLYVGRTLTGYAKIASDLTRKKRHAEELQRARDELEARVRERTRELAESNLALVREMGERETAEKQRTDLLRRLVSSQEFERRRIARDIHDQLGQRLTALRLKIASLRELAADQEPFASRVRRLQEISERLDTEVSFLAWELRPSTLDDLGLVEAIGAFVNEWSRHYEIPADFHSAGLSNERFGNDTETHLYRIIQEALNNIAKHANAKCVNVLLERRGGDLILIAEDDGTGFDPASKEVPDEPGSGLGLVGMRERAALIGGSLEIESTKGKGTTIYVRVPLSDNIR
jgi:PAS domain S-box-containing protein